MEKSELIFVTTAGVGHLRSTVEFSQCLVAHDGRISVTLLRMGYPCSSPADAYGKSLQSSPLPGIQIIDLIPENPPPFELKKKSEEYYIFHLVESYIPQVRAIVTNRIESNSESGAVRVTGFIVDFFCVSMIDVANEVNLPSYMFLTTGANFLSIMLHLPNHHDEISSKFKSSGLELPIPGYKNLVPVSVHPPVLSGEYGYNIYVKLAQRFRDVKGIIVNTFYELQEYAIDCLSSGLNPPVYPVGPVLDLKHRPNPDSEEDLRHRILSWLDGQPNRSVVFLCFGSYGVLSEAQVKEIAMAFEKTEYRFIWSIRDSLPEDIVSKLNFGANHKILPVGFLEKIQGRGMVCGWAPQMEVLAHRTTGAFVSHCGWNSTLESLWYGVPPVTWPLYAEQQLNAFTLVKELGLSVELRLDSKMVGGDLVVADEIIRAVRCVMNDGDEIRKKVEKMSETGRRALMEGGSSFVSIGKFIDMNFEK